tara:strand:+ start:99 stop:872 length:774 start_codon:yes stop_codon:yes gene_type:complete
MLLGLAAQYMAKPKPIDPQKVYDMATSPFNQDIYDRSNDLIDQDSKINRDVFDKMLSATQDNTYVANRINRQNMNATGMGGQSGILTELANQNTTKNNANMLSQYQDYVRNNMSMSNNMLTTATSNDMQARQPMVDAYGQNINNKNNWMASMAGNVTKFANMIPDMASKIAGAEGGASMASLAPMLLCDANMKENIKKVGTAKAKDGKKVNIFSYNYKGRSKKRTGVVAQDVAKTHPHVVKKGKNGKLYVGIGGLFG